MSAPTTQQLHSHLSEIFLDAPPSLHGNTRLAVPDRPRSLNALQHGLSGQHVLLDADEIQLYARMGLDYMVSLKPVGALETGAAQLYFEDRWRLHRILSVENNLFFIDPPKPGLTPGPDPGDPQPSARKSGLERQVNAFREEARNIDLISRYETRLMRNSGRLMEEIRTLRIERAKTDPDLAYNEQTDPAAAWYRKLIAQAERIAAARVQPKQKESKAAQQTTQTSKAAKSTPPTKISFGNKSSGAPTQPSEPTPQRPKIPDAIPKKTRDQSKSIRTAAA
jgi:hypothetical protein